MTQTIGELAQRGARALEAGDTLAALGLYWRLVDVAPGDVGWRWKLADVLAHRGDTEAAEQVYAATARLALAGGYPLAATFIGKILQEAGRDATSLCEELSTLYARGSARISGYGERRAPLDPDTPVTPPDLDALTPEQLVTGAARAGARLDEGAEGLRRLHPIPLLSDLANESFRRVLDALVAHRLPDGTRVIRQGEMGASFFLIARGAVRVFRTDDEGQETELAEFHEGALFGEMALLHASPRIASVEVLGEADLLEVPRDALTALAIERQPVADALDRFRRERLLQNLLATQPLFRPFSPEQRLDLLKRFTGHEVAPGTVIVREGEPAQGLYTLLSGEVDVTHHEPPRDPILLATLKTGESFGEVALLEDTPAWPTSITSSPRRQLLFPMFEGVVDPRIHADSADRNRLPSCPSGPVGRRSAPAGAPM